jgi:hypothetical protein
MASQSHFITPLRVESLERRELLAADMAGVVRGTNQYLLDTNRDPAVEIDRASAIDRCGFRDR